MDGQYSVKSGYWVQSQIILQRGIPQEVLFPNLHPLFQQLWKMEASPKVKHFIWRCLSNCLPVAGNLAHRHLSKDARCTNCDANVETVNHMLFKCHFARLTWALSLIPAPKPGEWSESLYTNFHWVLNFHRDHSQKEELAKLIPWIMWRLWKTRNSLIFNGIPADAHDLLRKAAMDAEEWAKRVEMEDNPEPKMRKPTMQPSTNQVVGWRKPPPHWFKCNVDGAWTPNKTCCGIGWALRTEAGNAVWIGERTIPRTKTVIETELEALRWAMISVARLQFDKVIFEPDSQELVAMANKEKEEWLNLRPVFQDVHNLSHNFHEVKFVFTPRGGNSVADRIAKEALSSLNYVPKLYSIMPKWIQNALNNDM